MAGEDTMGEVPKEIRILWIKQALVISAWLVIILSGWIILILSSADPDGNIAIAGRAVSLLGFLLLITGVGIPEN